MKRGMGRKVALGLLAGGLLVMGCERAEEAGRPHTPIQQKYQGGTTGAAAELDGREGFNMPDWQNHPTMSQEEEDAWRSGEASILEPETPLIPAPEEPYQTAEDVMAPRAGEGTPQVETVPGQPAEEQAIGGGGQGGIPQEWRGCQRALASPEPSSVVTGSVRHVSKDLLTVEDPRGRRMDLHADQSTCLLWNGQPVQPSQIHEGTTVRVSFVVDPEDGATARVVRVIEQQRPAP